MHPTPRTSRTPARPKHRGPHPTALPLAVAGLVAGLLWVVAPATTVASSAPSEAARRAPAAGLFANTRPTSRVVSRKGKPRETGMRFRPKVRGRVIGLQFYKKTRSRWSTPRTATLWNARGKVLARARIAPTRRVGWRSVTFSSPVRLRPRRSYVASIHTRANGRHSVTPHGFDRKRDTKVLLARGGSNGVLRMGRTSAFPHRQAPKNSNYWVDVRFVPGRRTSGNWPGRTNTGVPAGTDLRPYTGPCRITSPARLRGVDAKARCGELIIQTKGVVIENSRVPRVESTYGDGASSVTILRSDVRAGRTSTGALWGYHITARRVDVTGGQHSFHCNSDCTLTDSWLHGQHNPDGGSYHNNAFISNGGHDMVVRHNTLHCTPTLNSTDGGCTADVSLFGDFGPIRDVVIDNNLLKANNSSISYCAYGGHQPSKPYPVARHVRFTDNVFERGPNRRCGVYGPVTSFQRSATGNVWSGNRWTSGGVVSP